MKCHTCKGHQRVCVCVRVCVRMRMYLWKVQELEADHIAAAVDTGKTLQWQHI